ncbi:carotenoid phi-ring synthase-like isoform X2 [Lineus longissimus]|uniref:carotenoid phi-ring synthase-like isoform X2 n=1 Tax=Lineus longissimus TaxID=88925 RepID=UPI00315C8114
MRCFALFSASAVLFLVFVCCNGAPKPPRIIPPLNPKAPEKLPANKTCSVLVIGGGVAGLSAATELAQKGFTVTVREAAASAGGRLATRKIKALNQTFSVSNMFASWMHNHYQFHDILARLGVGQNFQPWEKIDYYFKTYKPEEIYNKNSYPWNIVGMMYRSKNIHITDAALAIFRSSDLRDYDYDKVFQSTDGESFQEWRAKTKIPQDVYDILFEPLVAECRNNPNDTSAAEMLTYFQIYYMSDKDADEAMRSVANVTYDRAFLNSWVNNLTQTKKVKFDYGKQVSELEFMPTSGSSSNVTSDNIAPGERYKYVIMATDLLNAKAILKNSMNDNTGVPGVYGPLSDMMSTLHNLEPAAPYKILRVWYDKQPNKDRPAVINTPDMTPLNLVVQHHLLVDEYIKWAKKSNGSMIEYQLNQWTFGDMNATEVLQRIQRSIKLVFPELISNKAKVLFTSLDTFQKTPSFATNMEKLRPTTAFSVSFGIPNLFMAGDWLRTTYPAALMEKAVSTGREAANQIFLKEGVRQVALKVTSSKGPGWL